MESDNIKYIDGNIKSVSVAFPTFRAILDFLDEESFWRSDAECTIILDMVRAFIHPEFVLHSNQNGNQDIIKPLLYTLWR